jgi:hypothetical protein
MTSVDASQRAEAEQWFLDRGLPSVLRPGALVRRVWSRSAPALAAFGVMMAFSIIVVLITGKHDRYQRAPHPDRMVRPHVGGAGAAVRGAGRLAGVRYPPRP